MSKLLPLIALAATLAAPAADARTRGVPPATPSGPAVDCLLLREVRETRVRDDRTIDFYLRDRRVYRNTLPFACPDLGFEEAFSYRTSTQQLCAVDTIMVIRRLSGIPGPTCGLGKFQPVTGLR